MIEWHVFSGWCSKHVGQIYRSCLLVTFSEDTGENNYSRTIMMKWTNAHYLGEMRGFGGFFCCFSESNSLFVFNRPGAREEPSVQQAQRRSAVFLSFKSPIPCLPLRWEQQSKLLPTVAGIPASKVSKWSTDEVYFIVFVCQGPDVGVLLAGGVNTLMRGVELEGDSLSFWKIRSYSKRNN